MKLIPRLTPQSAGRIEWEVSMYAAMCEQADCTNSDAQAIAEGQWETVACLWLMGASPEQTATAVLNASEVKA
jgi:hypothetical protein